MAKREKTAKALVLTFPPLCWYRANEVIEQGCRVSHRLCSEGAIEYCVARGVTANAPSKSLWYCRREATKSQVLRPY